jgi:hypothetical protein
VGPSGPRGLTGPAGPGAARISYDATASATPTTKTFVSVAGLTVSGACLSTGGQTALAVSIRSTENATVQQTISNDSGSDIAAPGPTSVKNFQNVIPAGQLVQIGGPSAAPPNYERGITTLIYYSASHVITINVVVIIDAAHGTCTAKGIAVPS